MQIGSWDEFILCAEKDNIISQWKFWISLPNSFSVLTQKLSSRRTLYTVISSELLIVKDTAVPWIKFYLNSSVSCIRKLSGSIQKLPTQKNMNSNLGRIFAVVNEGKTWVTYCGLKKSEHQVSNWQFILQLLEGKMCLLKFQQNGVKLTGFLSHLQSPNPLPQLNWQVVMCKSTVSASWWLHLHSFLVRTCLASASSTRFMLLFARKNIPLLMFWSL